MFPHFQQEREDMVRWQIEERGLHNQRLLEALRKLPRHLFVQPGDEIYAYYDEPIPIGFHQTISQPYITALMTSLAALEGKETVLEVGTGSGYQAALLGMLSNRVISMERIPELAERARKIVDEVGIKNVEIIIGDGTGGYPPEAPYQAILVTAAAPSVPQVLLDQLTDGGRLIIPTGTRSLQQLQVWQRRGSHFDSEDILPVVFVPLLGQYGWKER
ncbi:protein-L-isoaspartate O-methyltransferase [Leptolinea tardivitalis]|uniref:Protein-L-isoaspartate O-methyltransferase n=2 Tax=Leptolinea tardivitalis TaxID=229920 RepID=A0A0P6XPP9_9CHLR|nr:protein-L-isoaspartate O-methyltransferase [Leptolinea tardivitalis]